MPDDHVFPTSDIESGIRTTHRGLKIEDVFAALAMHALLDDRQCPLDVDQVRAVCEQAYVIADGMMRERER